MISQSRWGLALPVGYMAAIFLLSSTPGYNQGDHTAAQVMQGISPQWQNLLHIPLYGGLALSWAFALTAYRLTLNRLLTLSFALTVAWAVFDEIYQISVPGRYGSLTDTGLNIVGALCAVALVRLRCSKDC